MKNKYSKYYKMRSNQLKPISHKLTPLDRYLVETDTYNYTLQGLQELYAEMKAS